MVGPLARGQREQHRRREEDAAEIATGESCVVVLVTENPAVLARAEVWIGPLSGPGLARGVELFCPSGRLVMSDIAFEDAVSCVLPAPGRCRIRIEPSTEGGTSCVRFLVDCGSHDVARA
ncbi:MAG: hypothetical protein F2812_08025 [Actinobacteria bacterium]|nr:hypothetical protein [Actinomycetota bacterium]MSY71260.1 hypothetical protein [Actinomycetota bacterium]